MGKRNHYRHHCSEKSADPGLRQGRGGAWDHRRCGTCFSWPLAAACTKHSSHKPLLLERCSLPFASIALCCSGVQACRLPALKPLKGLKSLAAACIKHSGHRPLLLERCSLPFASLKTLKRLKIPRGCLHPALRPQAFVARTPAASLCC